MSRPVLRQHAGLGRGFLEVAQSADGPPAVKTRFLGKVGAVGIGFELVVAGVAFIEKGHSQATDGEGVEHSLRDVLLGGMATQNVGHLVPE